MLTTTKKAFPRRSRAYIQRVIDENGYQPNKQAKGLAEQKTNTLLFVYENTPDNPFFTELIRGAIDGAKEATRSCCSTSSATATSRIIS